MRAWITAHRLALAHVLLKEQAGFIRYRANRLDTWHYVYLAKKAEVLHQALFPTDQARSDPPDLILWKVRPAMKALWNKLDPDCIWADQCLAKILPFEIIPPPVFQ